MKKIVVVAVRMAIEVPKDADQDQCYKTALASTVNVMDAAVMGDNPVVNWEFDEWGISPDNMEHHINEMYDGYGTDDVVPFIRERHVMG